MALGMSQAVSPNSPGEVCHLHHDHTHLLGQHDDVIAVVIPFGHLCIQLALLLSEALDLLSNLGLFLLRKLCHDGLQATGDVRWKTKALEKLQGGVVARE